MCEFNTIPLKIYNFNSMKLWSITQDIVHNYEKYLHYSHIFELIHEC